MPQRVQRFSGAVIGQVKRSVIVLPESSINLAFSIVLQRPEKVHGLAHISASNRLHRRIHHIGFQQPHQVLTPFLAFIGLRNEDVIH